MGDVSKCKSKGKNNVLLILKCQLKIIWSVELYKDCYVSYAVRIVLRF